jgi:hypothetical protein
MSATQIIATGGGIGAVIGFVITAAFPPPPIEIHSLTYDNGFIVQERTINAPGPEFYAGWQAQIINVATGQVMPGCAGAGGWDYKVGTYTARLPLSEWVGSPCVLPPGEYQPWAKYKSGSLVVEKRGTEFVIE